MSECQNAVVSDSEGYDSDNAALQIMATEIESDDMRDVRKIQGRYRIFKLMKGKNGTTSFLPER